MLKNDNRRSGEGGPDRNNPVLVEVSRGGLVESRHRGAVAVVDARGKTVFSAGDIDTPVYPRSSLKPIQALPLVESGALAHFALDASHLCLACASHNGESEHARRVASWLGHIGLSPADLECGVHPPYSEHARNESVRAGTVFTTLQNNCSGKHAGFLTVARHLGMDHRGYIEPEHPLQQLVARTVEKACGFALSDAEPAVDGCGIPVYGIPLRHLAKGFAGFSPATAGHSKAHGDIVKAILDRPFLIAGSGRFCTRVIAASRGRAIMKTGAEGVYTGTLLEEGLGIALKIDDGATRAAEVAMAAALAMFGRDEALNAVLHNESSVPVINAAGRNVGSVSAISFAAL